MNFDFSKIGFVNEPVDFSLDLFAEINKLKKEKNAIILAHYYQDADIQDVADYIGDSLGLSQEAAKTDADIIVFAGVHFMAETAKILCPSKKVVLPDLRAGCSLADSCPADKFAEFKKKYPDHLVISYINCTAELKTLTDIVCTSTNAVQIVESLPKDQKIIFAPDQHLGRYLAKQSGREFILFPGNCFVHTSFSAKEMFNIKQKYPEAAIIAHPECEEVVLNQADFIGSTTSLLKFTQESPKKQFIVMTESGILHQMKKMSPNKEFLAGPDLSGCSCNECPHMKLSTMEKLHQCLLKEEPEITVDPDLAARALKPINKMMEMSQ